MSFTCPDVQTSYISDDAYLADLYNWLQTFNFDQALEDTPTTLRKTQSFGYDFFKLMQGDRSFVDVPEKVFELCQRASASLSNETLPECNEYQNVIISRYSPGYHLEPHVDMDKDSRLSDSLGFYFGDVVLGVVIKSDVSGHLYLTNDVEPTNPVCHIDEQEGTVFVLQDESRFRPWMHGVSNVTLDRVSITFRTVEFTGNSAALVECNGDAACVYSGEL